MVVTTRRNLVTALIFFVVVALVATFVYSKQSERNRGIIPSLPGAQRGVGGTSTGTAGGTGSGGGTGTSTGTGSAVGSLIATGAGTGSALTGGADFFVDYRLERDRIRSQQVEMLREIINNPKADDASRKEASTRWLALTEELGKETELENLVKAKGFEDALVFLQGTTAVVIIKAKDLNVVESSKVMDVIKRGTGIKSENINVMTKPR